MIWVPGGTFWMGCADCGMPDADPLHLVRVDGFWMDDAPVTNAQFERFVRETGYVTIAEQPLDPKQFPGVPASKLVPGLGGVRSSGQRRARSTIRCSGGSTSAARAGGSPKAKAAPSKGREHHPVVHVAWDDAVAYLKWAGKELPTEAQYEFAARGGLDRKHYAWGDELHPQGQAAANIWQGSFPGGEHRRRRLPRHVSGQGLSRQRISALRHGRQRLAVVRRLVPPGLLRHARPGRGQSAGPADSFDPAEPGVPKRVQRGGSYLCADEYCTRYLVGSRGKGAVDSGSSNVSFRGVRSGRALAVQWRSEGGQSTTGIRTTSGARRSDEASAPLSSRMSAKRFPFTGGCDSNLRTSVLMVARLPVSGCSMIWNENARRPGCRTPAGSASLTVPSTLDPAGTSSRPSLEIKGRRSRPSIASARRLPFDDSRVLSSRVTVVPAAI